MRLPRRFSECMRMSRRDRNLRGVHPELLLWMALVALLTLLAGQ
jgi:hypothetical protein